MWDVSLAGTGSSSSSPASKLFIQIVVGILTGHLRIHTRLDQFFQGLLDAAIVTNTTHKKVGSQAREPRPPLSDHWMLVRHLDENAFLRAVTVRGLQV